MMRKKQLLAGLLALVMLLALLPAGALADEPQLYNVYQGDGFYITVTPFKLNSTKYRITASNAEAFRTFYDGYLFVETANVDENYVNRRFVSEFNLADKNGNIILPEGSIALPEGDFLSMYKSGHYVPSEGLIAFWDGKTRDKSDEELIGFMDYQGNVVIPCQFHHYRTEPFSGGYARTSIENENDVEETFIIDKTGRIVLRSYGDGMTTSFGSDFASGLIQVEQMSGAHGTSSHKVTYGYVDAQGNMALPLVSSGDRISRIDPWADYADGAVSGYLMPVVGKAGQFSEDGYAVAADLRSGDRMAYTYAIIDTSGNVVGTFRDMEPESSTESGGFHDGLLRVAFIDNRGNKSGYGYVDPTGNVVWREGNFSEGGIDAGDDYSCGVTVVRWSGVVDTKGNIVIPQKVFDSVGSFNSDLSLAFVGKQPYVLEIHQGTYTGSGRVYGQSATQQPSAPAQPETPSQPTEQPSSWAQADVTAAVEAGLVPESLRGSYTQATTRAEFCALAVALYETVTGKEIEGRTTFSDTSDVNVEKAAYLGVVNGIGNNRFGPEGTLTREQAAAMLSRLASAVGKPLTDGTPDFADNGSISGWAQAAVGQMKASGVMGGVGNNTFAPKGDYSREQSIITIKRLFELVK